MSNSKEDFYSKINGFVQGASPTVKPDGSIDPNFGNLNSKKIQYYEDDGFLLPATPTGDGASLPSTHSVQGENYGIPGHHSRKMIHWYIPQYGVIKMYINPESVGIRDTKLITKSKTKGGFNLQYWGEELTTLEIRGTTGTSGIEGINILYELYRAEQYAFDGVGLALAAANANNDQINNLLLKNGSVTNGILSISGVSGTSLDLNSFIAPQNIPTLAQIAFGIEMYYFGWVYRGYFTSFSITESASSLGLYTYNLNFTATQRRGYRNNRFPWEKTPNNGPSNSDITGNLTYKQVY